MPFWNRSKRDTIEIFNPKDNQDYGFGPYSDGSFVSSVLEQVLVAYIPP